MHLSIVNLKIIIKEDQIGSKSDIMNLIILKKKLKTFKNELYIFDKNFKISLYKAVLYALILKLSGKKQFITDELVIKNVIGKETFEHLKNLKSELGLKRILTD